MLTTVDSLVLLLRATSRQNARCSPTTHHPTLSTLIASSTSLRRNSSCGRSTSEPNPRNPAVSRTAVSLAKAYRVCPNVRNHYSTVPSNTASLRPPPPPPLVVPGETQPGCLSCIQSTCVVNRALALTCASFINSLQACDHTSTSYSTPLQHVRT